jgi:hypothetical protein
MWQVLTLSRRPPEEGGNEYPPRNRTPWVVGSSTKILLTWSDHRQDQKVL